LKLNSEFPVISQWQGVNCFRYAISEGQ